ncbi:hypothetical protein GSY74_05075 [Sulfurovum sp. bin170]|uniref:hypothetical protein n=1 Tax=Sulfurovum sp. bin170 TaxID=2695268 RepID=UPI0013DFA7F9|nr:hypothetical protein [Sulfurovum sp. bin170]NEW60649.1 hypothetical protein [Sulfurovum sp. bin170]
MQKPFIWDRYSDQPYPIKDKVYKKKMRKKHIFDYIPLILTNLIIFPLSIVLMKFFKGKKIDKENFYGMGVDLDKGDIQIKLIEELGVKHILMRMPLWEMDRIDEYVDFAKKFKNQTTLLNILQDREHIEDIELLQKNIKSVFEKFSPIVTEYQIGNAINRTKWGFFSMGEYLKWYQTIQSIRDENHPTLKLIGSSVIDFEYHYTIRTLFNGFPIKYDKFSSLLYVDRRGSPSNTQMGIFDTKNKIDMIYSLVKLSQKTSNEIYITEVNWPLSGTAPYAPTSELECVSEEDYAKFMLEYLETAKKSDKIQRVYWHQLIATGYGLVDDRDNTIRKTPAFYEFKKASSIA